MKIFLLLVAVSLGAFAQEHKVGVNKYKTPYYPPIARQAHVQGDVVVEFELDPNGDVKQTKILSGHPMFRKVVEDAAREWRFICIDCKPGEFLMTWKVTFRFQFQGEQDDGYWRTYYRFELPDRLIITTPPSPPLYVQQTHSATP